MPANNVKIKSSQYLEIQNFLLTHTNKQAAEKYKVHEGTIEKICAIIGLKKGRPFKHVKDESFFEMIDSHDKAYLLGIMYSDGYVKKNACFGVSLNKKDVEILSFFKEKIKYSGPLKTSASFTNKNQVSLEICSRKICKDLIKLGCMVNKSLILEWPSFLEATPYVWSFILGVIDGDGHIQNYSTTVACKITGAVKFCEGLRFFLAKNDIKSSIHNYKNPSTKDACIYSANAISLFRKILENQKFSLLRKRDIMEYRIFCADFLTNSKTGQAIRGTFLREAFDMFKNGEREELIKFINNHNKETYRKHGEKMKTIWVNQFTSAKQKSLNKEASSVNI